MTLISTVILYRSETWTSRKIEEIRLDTFERKVLRQIYGRCLDLETKEWRIQTNEELHDLFQTPSISREIAKRRLMWAGHTWRKKYTMINIVIKEEPEGKPQMGRLGEE